MKSAHQIKKMIKQLRIMQGDQQFQEQIYPISDVIQALKWVLSKRKKLALGSCTCRFIRDLEEAEKELRENNEQPK